VATGNTVVQPEDGTVPTSGLIETVLARLTAQVRVTFSPSVTVGLFPENALIDGGVEATSAPDPPLVPAVSTLTVTDLVI